MMKTRPFRWGFAPLAFLVLVSTLLAACSLAPISAQFQTTPDVVTATAVKPAQALPLPTATPAATATPIPTATPAPLVFEGGRAFKHVEEQVALGPRITGSRGSLKLGDQVLAYLAANGWQTSTQEFIYRGVPGRNLLGIKGGGPEVVILGAHYDTRRVADRDPQTPDQPVPGANDGGSGVAVLMELARALEFDKIGKQVQLVFFDAEDNGELDGWEWSAGARAFVSTLAVTPTAVVIVDMVGDQQQDFYYETNSDPKLMQTIWEMANKLGYGDHFHPSYKWSITDDHIPFRERGLPAIDIIDFDYPYWHTTEDTADKVSAASLARVGRVLEVALEGARVAPPTPTPSQKGTPSP
jgi:hypothetical protein